MLPARTKLATAVARVALVSYLMTCSCPASALNREARANGQELGVLERFDFSEADVTKAVGEVTQDQIVHGTYSYEKEKILYGAHSADSAKVFGVWNGPGKVFYKVADNVLAPRFFKNSGDIGKITVRYVVLAATPEATTVQINAIFVDARGVKHASDGSVEGAEYAAIQEHVKTIQADRRQLDDSSSHVAEQRPEAQHIALDAGVNEPLLGTTVGPSSPIGVDELRKTVDSLRQQVELRVRDAGATLKSAPFQSATTIISLRPRTEVVVVVLTSYWYGVETSDGHHGWVHHSQLEAVQ